MPVHRTPPRLLIALLAVPVIVAAYFAFAGGRLLAVLRATLAVVLGAPVIGAVYVDATWRHMPVPVRRAPLPTALAVGLALALVGTGLPGAQVQAHSPAEAVVEAALEHLGKPYVWGANGPAAFDCSGLIYRAFKQAGELPLIGGTRTTAARYFRWFATRGLATPNGGKRGDLVVYRDGAHIGIYLGKGKVLSAVDDRVQIHGLHALRGEFTAFLKVPWGARGADLAGATSSGGKKGKNPGDQAAGGRAGGAGQGQAGSQPADDETDAGTDAADTGGTGGKPADLPRGYAFGSLNMRVGPGPDERIISWLTRGSTFTILEAGRSPGGALWLRIEKRNGKQGWVWAERWTRVIEGSLEDLSN